MPLSKVVQGDYIRGINSLEELLNKKNEFFSQVLSDDLDTIRYRRAKITYRTYQLDSTFVMKLAANRPVEITNKFLEKEKVDNWPTMVVVFDNRPNKQYLAVEMRQKTFRYTDTVTQMLESNINKCLKKYQLFAQFEPLFEEKDFWNYVNKGEILSVRFYLVAPNLPDLSDNLSVELSNAIKRTNSKKAHLVFNSHPDQGLEISEDDENIKGLVDYAAGGGGTIHVKIRGVSALYKTNDQTKTITSDEMLFDGEFDPERIGEAVKRILDNV